LVNAITFELNKKIIPMKNLILSGIVILMMLVVSSCGKKAYPPVQYPFSIIEENLDSAKNLANSKNMNVFLMVHADWCTQCNIFKTTVLQSEDIKNTLANGIVTSLVDGDKDYGKPIASQYAVTGFPTFIILDKNGVVLQRKTGGMAEADFKKWVTPYLK
jgi:thioredoxin-related protein